MQTYAVVWEGRGGEQKGEAKADEDGPQQISPEWKASLDVPVSPPAVQECNLASSPYSRTKIIRHWAD